jgi:hypothetical protein
MAKVIPFSEYFIKKYLWSVKCLIEKMEKKIASFPFFIKNLKSTFKF